MQQTSNNWKFTAVVLNTGYFSYAVVVLGRWGFKVDLNFLAKLSFKISPVDGVSVVAMPENFAEKAAIRSSMERVVVKTSVVVVVDVVVVDIVDAKVGTNLWVVSMRAMDVAIEASFEEISVVEDTFSS